MAHNIQWPTEHAATVAVDAAARKLHELNAPVERDYDDLDPMIRNGLREAVLPLVWAALAALPDPRYAAFEEGYTSGHSNAMRRMSDEPNAPTTPNPYQEG